MNTITNYSTPTTRAPSPPTEVVVDTFAPPLTEIPLEDTEDRLPRPQEDTKITVELNLDETSRPPSFQGDCITDGITSSDSTDNMRSSSNNNSCRQVSGSTLSVNEKIKRKASDESIFVAKNLGSCQSGSSICSRLLFIVGWMYSVFRLLFVILQNLYHIPTYLFFNWIVFYPIYFFIPKWFLWLENFTYNLCLYTVASWSWMADIQVIECGDDIFALKDELNAAAKREKKRLLKNRKHDNHVKRPRDLIYKEKVASEVSSPVSTNSSVLSPQQQQSLGNNNTSSIEEGHLGNNSLPRSQNNAIHSSIHSLNAKNSENMQNRTSTTLIDVASLDRTRDCLDSHPNDKGKVYSSKKLSSPLTPSSSSVSILSSMPSNGRVLLMANHQCTSDVPLMFQSLMSRAKYVLLWVMDFQFKYTNFGVVSGTHGDYFITPKTFVKSELTKHCLSNPDKDLIILFPEGGFRYKRAASSDKYAEKKGLPKLQHLTWPRTGAFLDLTEGNLGLTHIVDMTILYMSQRKCATILDITLGRNAQPIYFHYKIFEVDPLVAYDENWLNQRWLEKEQLMKSFYDDPQEFLRTKAGQLRPIKLSLLKLVFNQFCILAGCVVMYLVVKYLLSIFIR